MFMPCLETSLIDFIWGNSKAGHTLVEFHVKIAFAVIRLILLGGMIFNYCSGEKIQTTFVISSNALMRFLR